MYEAVRVPAQEVGTILIGLGAVQGGRFCQHPGRDRSLRTALYLCRNVHEPIRVSSREIDRRLARGSWRSSRRRVMSVLVSAGLLLVAPDAEARKLDTAPRAAPNRIDINYVQPKSADYQPIFMLLKERQALEKIRDLLSPLR